MSRKLAKCLDTSYSPDGKVLASPAANQRLTGEEIKCGKQHWQSINELLSLHLGTVQERNLHAVKKPK